jgi:hypothetical protein
MAFQLPPPPGVNEFRSASWQDWFFKLRAGLISAFNTITLQGIPPDGNTNDVLTKVSGTDYDVTWAPVPGSSTVVPPPCNNIVQNSYFQVRHKTDQATVAFATAAPYSQHARRWYGVAATADFETQLDSGNDQNFITIKRTAGTNTDPVRLVQILDTEDSIKWVGQEKVLRFYFLLNSGANVSSVSFSVSSGTGVDESLDDYLTGSWTSQAELVSAALPGSYNFYFSSLTQIAFEIKVEFFTSASATDDEVYIYYVLVDDPSDVYFERDSKSLAVVQRECQRYYQQLDLYLTTAEISVPISMRAVPVVTLGDAAAFTTTGTTAEVLVIKVNSSGDNGMHTVYLDAEL